MYRTNMCGPIIIKIFDNRLTGDWEGGRWEGGRTTLLQLTGVINIRDILELQ